MVFMVACVDLKSVADSSISREDSNIVEDNIADLKSPELDKTKGNKVALVGFSEGDIAPEFTLKTTMQPSVSSDQLLNEYDGLFILFYSDW
jgi:hypothetical protein|tara:strand:+ start:276 stop:548 length:273 start_codon:yes stop_codon:yes gene_type:complete